MTKIILSIIFIIISVLTFTMYTRGAYDEINKNRVLISNYNSALEKARMVTEKLRELIGQRNQISDLDLAKLQKMMPTSVDNIQLILDIEGVTKRYDMKLQKVNISKNVSKKNKKSGARINVGAGEQELVKSLDISFEVVSSYDEFIKFIVDLEHSLRIVDVVSIALAQAKDSGGDNAFNSGLVDVPGSLNTQSEHSDDTSEYTQLWAPKYTFSVVLRTYWLNNK